MDKGSRLLYKLVQANYTLQHLIIKLCTLILYKKLNNRTEVKKILLLRKGNIGDHVCALPALQAIRENFPQASIHCLTSSGNNPELRIDKLLQPGFFAEVMEFSQYSIGGLYKQIRQARYDLVIELPQNLDTLFTQLRNLFFFRLAGIRCGFGWQVANTFLFRKVQLKYRHFDREPVRLLHLLEQEGISADERYKLLASAEHFPRALPTHKKQAIALAVGAKQERNRWPLTYFKQVALELCNRGYQVYILGNAEDRERVADFKHAHLHNYCALLKPEETVLLLKHCRLCISNDSGPMHLAYAAGTAVLAVFSGRNYPYKWFPPATAEHKVLSNYQVPCAICADKVCSDNICMQAIYPGQLLLEVDKLLSAQGEIQSQ